MKWIRVTVMILMNQKHQKREKYAIFFGALTWFDVFKNGDKTK